MGTQWKKHEVLKSWGVLAMPLNDFRSIATVEGQFETGQKIVLTSYADGSIRFEIKKPSELTTSSFSDVYHVSGSFASSYRDHQVTFDYR